MLLDREDDWADTIVTMRKALRHTPSVLACLFLSSFSLSAVVREQAVDIQAPPRLVALGSGLGAALLPAPIPDTPAMFRDTALSALPVGVATTTGTTLAPARWTPPHGTITARDELIGTLLQFERDAKFPDQERSIYDSRDWTIDHLPARYISNTGLENSGIYALEREGEPRVLKVLKHVRGEEYPRGPFKDRTASRQLRGGLLGALVKGPQIRRAGVIKTGGDDRYFIEMTELFPGLEREPLKEAAMDSDYAPQKFARLFAPRSNGQSPARQMAAMFVGVLEKGIVPNDIDFMIEVKDGNVAWVDTFLWQTDRDASFPERLKEVTTALSGLVLRVSKDPVAKAEFSEGLAAALKTSTLSQRIKDQMLRTAAVEND